MGGGLCVLLGVSDRETDASVVGLPLDMGGDCDGALCRRDGAAIDLIIWLQSYIVCIVRIVLIAVTVIGERGNLGQGTERKQIHTTKRSGG